MAEKIKIDHEIQQPSAVHLEPEHEVHQQTWPSSQQQQQQQQQQMQQQPQPANQQQFAVSGTQPQAIYPPQQPQFVAVQPYGANGVAQGYQVHVAQPPQYQQGAVVFGTVNVAPKNWNRTRYRTKAAKTLGAFQIIFAVLAVILGIITAVASAFAAFIGMPIWGGVCFFLPAGILGIVATKPTNMQNCVINGCLVMSVLSAIVAALTLTLSIVAPFHEGEWRSDYNGFNSYFYVYTPRVIYWALLAFVSLGEFIVAITQSAYCCHARCNCCGSGSGSNEAGNTTVRYVGQPAQPAQPMQHMAAYPMQQQQQQQQIMVQQQQLPSYGVQNVTMVQNAPQDARTTYNNVSDDNAVASDGTGALPKYSNSPPPDYSLTHS